MNAASCLRKKMTSLIRLLTMAAMCISCTSQKKIGTEPSSDELLRRLVELARQGRGSLCSPVELERMLNIKIENLEDQRKRVGDRNFIIELSGEVAPDKKKGIGETISGGRYIKFKSEFESFCHLGLILSKRQLCDADSKRVQDLMGTRVQYLGDTIHAPGHPIVYTYPHNEGGEVQVSLGSTREACSDTVTVRYQGEWR